MRDGFKFLLKRYPESVRNKSTYALYAGMAGECGTLRQAGRPQSAPCGSPAKAMAISSSG